MGEILVRNVGHPKYILSRDYSDVIVDDPILPSGMLEAEAYPEIVAAAYSPLSWAAMDRSQLCFSNGPIERTDLKRYTSLWGQVLLDIGLGSTPEEVRAHFVQDGINDATHRVYSHSSDFLIQSFKGPQDAHDQDASNILQHFDFMQAATAAGMHTKPMAKRATDSYPDLNLDRLEFGLRQMYGMGWLPIEKYNTKTSLNRLVTIQPDGSLAFTNQDFAMAFSVAFSYLGSENWLNPLQRAMLLNQQYELKHRMSAPHFTTLADFLARRNGFSGRAHPFDGLYDAEWTTEPDRYVVTGDLASRDIDFVSKSLAGLARSRGRIRELTGHINDVVYNGQDACRFVDPLHPFGEGQAVPVGVSIYAAEVQGDPAIVYDKHKEALVYSLPGGMKRRVLDPQLAEGGRLSANDAFAGFKANYGDYTVQGHVLVLHGIGKAFGRRFIDHLQAIEAQYQAALLQEKLPSNDVALIVEHVGRLSMEGLLEQGGTMPGSYPFTVIIDPLLCQENKAQLHASYTTLMR